MTMIAAAVMALLPGLWMAVGVWDNWRFPALNRDIVAQVMRLERMEQDYPVEFGRVAHRRIKSDGVIALAFRLVVLWETLAAVLLITGAAMLAFGLGEAGLARDVALAGALVFTSNWAGFLIGGNYFCYYFCHFEGQFTHFLLLLWGGLVVLLLALI